MQDLSESELLRLLAERVGIANEYQDIAGTLRVTTEETRRAILAAMKFRVADRSQLIEELTAWDNRVWEQGCDPVRVVRLGLGSGTWSLYTSCEDDDEAHLRIHWTIVAESGAICCEQKEGPGLKVDEVRMVHGRRHVAVSFTLPRDLTLGYYDVTAQVTGRGVDTRVAFRLIVAPQRCYVPTQLQQGRRLWGLALQLYSLQSERNWGFGDFHDLAEVVEWAGKELGADVIGLNPLHALKNSTPYHISPYSPNSRLFLNELYIDVEQIEECRTSAVVKNRLADPRFRARLEAVRKSELVDYNAVASAKRVVLDLCYYAFLRDNFSGREPNLNPTTARGRSFLQYVQQEGESLLQYAIFQALEEIRHIAQSPAVVWNDWPKSYQRPTSAAVEKFRQQHMDRVRFFQYLQWLAAGQLRQVVENTGEAGMAIGLYHDLALGSDRAGADAWRFQDVLALEADCGAPPDAFAPEGQNWGISPVDPIRLRSTGYRYFIELFRNNLRYGGAIRLDHVMALFRLFWIPRGHPTSAGTYVHYPADELLAILALESVRAEALVIGEDLGTVPDWVRDRLGQAGVLSYRVFYFEQEAVGRWKLPVNYPAQSLAVVTTHDLPTLSGFWEGADIRTRAGLGLIPSDDLLKATLADRQRDKSGILAALHSEGLLPPGVSLDPAQTPSMTEELFHAVYRYLARSPAWLVLANVEDVIGTRVQANVPGTVDEHPNWCRKLGVPIESLVNDQRFARLATQLRSERPLV